MSLKCDRCGFGRDVSVYVVYSDHGMGYASYCPTCAHRQLMSGVDVRLLNKEKK